MVVGSRKEEDNQTEKENKKQPDIKVQHQRRQRSQGFTFAHLFPQLVSANAKSCESAWGSTTQPAPITHQWRTMARHSIVRRSRLWAGLSLVLGLALELTSEL